MASRYEDIFFLDEIAEQMVGQLAKLLRRTGHPGLAALLTPSDSTAMPLKDGFAAPAFWSDAASDYVQDQLDDLAALQREHGTPNAAAACALARRFRAVRVGDKLKCRVADNSDSGPSA